MSNQSQRNRPPARGTGGANRGGGSGGNRQGGPKQPPRRQPAYYAPQRRDPFPYVLGGLLALLVVGVFAVVLMLSNNSNPPPAAVVPTTGPVDPNQPTTAPVDPAGAPPRIGLVEFKSIYDDPAQKANLLVIDVRAKASYDAGHIKDAQSYPEAEIDALAVKLPKDKLIVAYCQ